jgi:hypothetical protein
VPDDGRAHVIAVSIKQSSSLRMSVGAVAEADYSDIGSGVLNLGQTTAAYVSAGPGSTTLLSFKPFGGSSGRAELALTVTPENDAFEPNNARTSAAGITLGTSISAQLIIPYISDVDREPADWYSVTLVKGTTTVELLAAPGGQLSLSALDSNGTSRWSKVTAAGVTGSYTFDAPQEGTYYIGVTDFGSSHAAFATGAEPSYMTNSYTLRVSQ